MTRNVLLIGALLTMAACSQQTRPPLSPCDSSKATNVGDANAPQKNKPELSTSAVAWLAVDGMTKIQGIT